MPYDIKKQADGYHVFNQVTGEDKGVSKTRAKAEAHMRALYAHEGDAKRQNDSPGTATGDGMVLDSSYQPMAGDSYVDGKRVPMPPHTPMMKAGGKVTLKKEESVAHEKAESAAKEKREEAAGKG